MGNNGRSDTLIILFLVLPKFANYCYKVRNQKLHFREIQRLDIHNIRLLRLRLALPNFQMIII